LFLSVDTIRTADFSVSPQLCRSQGSRCLWRASAAARLLGLRVRIPPGHAFLYVVSVPEYLLSISDTSETVTYMETGMSLICVPSSLVTNYQNILPVSAEPSLITLSSLFLLTLPLRKLHLPDFRRSVQEQKC